ncbi:hypothetical protein LXA43DRAFT_1103485 [Ganoderma leucocontextum]|nr:hypothetical protein LXA43DRAFT_1103485 [Ganoderma leucocontextum]
MADPSDIKKPVLTPRQKLALIDVVREPEDVIVPIGIDERKLREDYRAILAEIRIKRCGPCRELNPDLKHGCAQTRALTWKCAYCLRGGLDCEWELQSKSCGLGECPEPVKQPVKAVRFKPLAVMTATRRKPSSSHTNAASSQASEGQSSQANVGSVRTIKKPRIVLNPDEGYGRLAVRTGGKPTRREGGSAVTRNLQEL